ncbi:MAG: PmoA family protein [Ignavibacteria bacterium]|jgi:hypothetical protein
MPNNVKKLFLFVIAVTVFYNCADNKEKQLENRIHLIKNDAEKRIDVKVNDELFTSYLYTDSLPVLKKTVLYPINAANGATITRGFPINPRPGERVDHPHHIGSWLNYGDVNGLDFWNNSDAIPPERESEMGTIRNESIVDIKSGKGKGELITASNWLAPEGTVLLKDTTHFIFYAGDGVRIIDRVIKLTALDEPVVFKDNKEGMIAIRVARQLELPSDQPVMLSDSHGKQTNVPVMDNKGVSGNYLSSEGIEGESVWGKRARWVALSGTVDTKDVTVVIFDNPGNVGFPTYWHARGYGLFAANPLGQAVFSNGEEKLNFSLAEGNSVTFKYRILILNGKADKNNIESEYQKFIEIK